MRSDDLHQSLLGNTLFWNKIAQGPRPPDYLPQASRPLPRRGRLSIASFVKETPPRFGKVSVNGCLFRTRPFLLLTCYLYPAVRFCSSISYRSSPSSVLYSPLSATSTLWLPAPPLPIPPSLATLDSPYEQGAPLFFSPPDPFSWGGPFPRRLDDRSRFTTLISCPCTLFSQCFLPLSLDVSDSFLMIPLVDSPFVFPERTPLLNLSHNKWSVVRRYSSFVYAAFFSRLSPWRPLRPTPALVRDSVYCPAFPPIFAADFFPIFSTKNFPPPWSRRLRAPGGPAKSLRHAGREAPSLNSNLLHGPFCGSISRSNTSDLSCI